MFTISSTPLEELDLTADLKDSAAGALVTFEGWVRNHNEGRPIRQLEYQAYEALASKEGTRILNEVKTRFEVIAARCVHRVGTLNIGEIAVWIGVIAAHRADAFRACEHIIDQIKLRVPIWKKEFYEEGDSGWVGVPGVVADQSPPTQAAT